jgi:hypothetical protein
VAEGEALDAVGDRLLDLCLRRPRQSYENRAPRGREIAIFKDGVVQ